MVFCAMVSWALYTLWLRGVPADINRIGLMGIQILLALLVLAPLYAYEREFVAAQIWTLQSITALAYLGIFPSVFAYVLYNIAVKRVGASKAGLSIHLIPVFGVVLAVLFLNEKVHGYHAVGMVAILAGVACAAGNWKWPQHAIRPVPARKIPMRPIQSDLHRYKQKMHHPARLVPTAPSYAVA
jgi:drug/metabolite transporter (DMT)-like permease